MKTQSRFEQLPLLLALTMLATSVPASAQSNDYTFTYQGRLKVNGQSPGDSGGPFEFRFKLFDAPTGGMMISGIVEPQDVPAPDGLFSVPLHFGTNVFAPQPGDLAALPDRWLEIEVRPASTNPAAPYTMLSPRQRVTPSPQALFADLAGKVRGNSIESSQIMTGAVTTVHLQNAAVTGAKVADGNLVRSLNGLKDQVMLTADEGLMLTPIGNELRLATSRSCSDYTNCYWNLLGNGNLTAGVNFLGTVAGEFDPVEFRVNNTHALRLVAGGVTPNLIGGHGGNSIASAVSGSHIGGGGEPGSFNSIEGSYDTIGGGSGNVIQKPSDYATVGGGNKNTIQTNSSYSTIGGGDRNTIQTNAPYATVGGGVLNSIAPGARWSAVAGGIANLIGTNVGYGFIGGGTNNMIFSDATGAAIGGGSANSIQADADNATVGGGTRNLIGTSTPFATIPGGQAAAAGNYGQLAYASGGFTATAQGDAQLSFHVLRRSLTSAVTNELFLDGDAAARRMGLRPEATWTFDILVSARTDAGLSAGYRITGIIRRPTVGAISFVGAPATTVFGNDMGGGNVFVEADVANNALVIKAAGAAVPTRWVATVRTTELIY